MKKPSTYLLGLLAGFGLLGGNLPLQGQCLDDWTLQREITLTNPGSAMTDFQVKLTLNTAAFVGAGEMQADGDDIRFTLPGSCCNFLCYSIESGMNSASTVIWVKIPNLPAGSSTLLMSYGNPSALNGQDANCTFDMWEPFDSPTNHFAPTCGSGTYTVSGGSAAISWSSNYVMASDVTFPIASGTYTAEGWVNSASGNWPGINLSKVSPDYKGYSILLGSGVRIGEAGTSASDFCRGENWASAVQTTPGSVVGLWSVTWIATGNIIAEFPNLGTLTSTSITHPLNADLKVCIGGISGGTGAMNLDWVRVRKYSPATITSTLGAAQSMTASSIHLGNDTTLCPGFNLLLDAGSATSDWLWSTGDTSQTLSVTTAGTYSVSGLGSNGCPTADTLTISEFTPNQVWLGPDGGFCQGDTVNLDAWTGFLTYLWSTGDTTQSIDISIGGTYSVSTTDSNGCASADTIVMAAYSVPTAGFTFGATNLTVNFSNTSTPGTYFWDFGDGNSSTDTNATHTYSADGSYVVCLTVTSADGCTAMVCDTVSVIMISTSPVQDLWGIQVFPNPARGKAVVQANHPIGEISLFDLSGKWVKSWRGQTASAEVSFQGIPAGMYLLRVQTTEGSGTLRVVLE